MVISSDALEHVRAADGRICREADAQAAQGLLQPGSKAKRTATASSTEDGGADTVGVVVGLKDCRGEMVEGEVASDLWRTSTVCQDRKVCWCEKAGGERSG